MPQMTIKLTHSSNAPGASGEPGDVITCDAEIAATFINGGGAKLVEVETQPELKTTRKPRKQSAE